MGQDWNMYTFLDTQIIHREEAEIAKGFGVAEKTKRRVIKSSIGIYHRRKRFFLPRQLGKQRIYRKLCSGSNEEALMAINRGCL